ncbi:anti-sigma regulatory factor (Ser/Thr protein kinase) [Synechococcus sp. PCC 7502]|uniref:ATP-binding protein n=1 Tax=Synechococcus sp. PCC 7502 TaxID=1173263 RepID=UPI00029FD2C3|nr:ATP-binding protein [Synechococcus sp. PCC 7502]AFY73712.1 anti-sigma regulatory factor (Ser/Thr protein kinase) [Synechococcus sp. PCC 7502]
MAEKYSLRVKTDIYDLTTVQKWFQQFGNSSVTNATERVLQQMNLLLAEGFANVIYHAHEHLPIDTPVDIEVIFDKNTIEIRIWDFGQPFDLLQKLKEIQEHQIDPTDIDNLPTGGRGLQITQAIADRFSYERFKNRNCLVIYKSF